MMRRLLPTGFLWLGCTWAGVTGIDDRGQILTLPQAAARVVSLSPHATELLAEVGAVSKLIAVDSASDYPVAVAKLPKVGSYGAINVEAIVALKPDLVVAWEGPGSSAGLKRLRDLGVPVFASTPGKIEQIPAAAKELGRLVGADAQAERFAGKFIQDWQALKLRYQTLPSHQTLLLVGGSPAISINDEQFLAQAVTPCGVRNLYGASKPAVPIVSDEAVLAAKPELIIAVANPAESRRWFAHWQGYSALPAVSRQRLVQADPIRLGRPGPRLVAAVDQLCRRIMALPR
ncbi:ABC transporter substrate-binding protein [Parachitinimonas caeni]|uniref:Helical backbone metal receptor n=1 Tax=Parachitinimonas caeni TaxID=3031301 RepID=A0ABT7DS75_9NEIS|nr:helical backbone metal receptor [Parachitinimonas caeni]MDK2122619.1 helical backbone metal receptor [Parachitinimonas caeni]